MLGDVNWIVLSQDLIQWRDFVNKVMILAGKCWINVYFSRDVMRCVDSHLVF
jgi:hypothetical protein